MARQRRRLRLTAETTSPTEGSIPSSQPTAPADTVPIDDVGRRRRTTLATASATPCFPSLGNPGIDVQHYTLTLHYDPARNDISATDHLDMVMTEDRDDVLARLRRARSCRPCRSMECRQRSPPKTPELHHHAGRPSSPPASMLRVDVDVHAGAASRRRRPRVGRSVGSRRPAVRTCSTSPRARTPGCRATTTPATRRRSASS